jgi:hypothetical protein
MLISNTVGSPYGSQYPTQLPTFGLIQFNMLVKLKVSVGV